jgi:hypothetical protein
VVGKIWGLKTTGAMQRSDIVVPKVIHFSSSVVMPPSSVVNAQEAVALFSHSDLEFLL